MSFSSTKGSFCWATKMWDGGKGHCSVAELCLTLHPHGLQHARFPCPSLSPSLLKLMSVESVMSTNHLILCCPLLLPSISPSIRVFSNECSGLISFRIDGLISLLSKGLSVFSAPLKSWGTCYGLKCRPEPLDTLLRVLMSNPPHTLCLWYNLESF